jgi:signal transduction histidine kinase
MEYFPEPDESVMAEVIFVTIRRRLLFSNVLMTAAPLLLSAVFVVVAFLTYGRNYVEPVVDMYESENGVYSAQSLIYACKEELSTREWEHYDWYEDNGLVMTEQTSKKMRMFEENLYHMGYHFEIAIHGKLVYSNFTDSDRRFVERHFGTALSSVQSMTLTSRDGAVVRNSFGPSDERGTVTAVYLPGRGVKGARSYLEKYVIAFAVVLALFLIAAITVADYALSGYIARMFLRPLAALRSGARRIAAGNLDVKIGYSRDDEFGEVCREFDQMRLRLKDSVEEKVRYENYRRMLISGISHDLRTPLTLIRGYAEGLRDGVASTPDMKNRYCSAIIQSARDMEMLADSLSTLARLENNEYRYQLQPTRLEDWLRDVVEEQMPVLAEKALLIFRSTAPALCSAIDQKEMRRVFVNLFTNSIKYSGVRPVTITTSLHEKSGTAVIRVCDNGRGVADDDLPHLFEAFYRGDKARSHAGEGSGLGLAIVRHIVEGCGGTIRACNEGGLCVEITLPACDEPKEAENSADCSHC